jgi:hypothetical protein
MLATPKRPFHVECYNCFDADERAANGNACVCGLERLRIEHAAMKALLTDIAKAADLPTMGEAMGHVKRLLDLVNHE